MNLTSYYYGFLTFGRKQSYRLKHKNGCTFPFRQKPTVVHSEETKCVGKGSRLYRTIGHKKSPNKVEHYPLLFGLVKPSLWVFDIANMVKFFDIYNVFPRNLF